MYDEIGSIRHENETIHHENEGIHKDLASVRKDLDAARIKHAQDVEALREVTERSHHVTSPFASSFPT